MFLTGFIGAPTVAGGASSRAGWTDVASIIRHVQEAAMSGDDRELLTLTEAELDLRLGAALFADDFGAKPPTDADKRRRAANWFSAHRERLQHAVCTHTFVKGYLSGKDAIEREVFDAVLAAVGSLAGISVPVGVLAAKIVRYGVTNLCAREETPAEPV